MRVEPFKAAHLDALILQPAQAAWHGRMSANDGAAFETAGDAWTGFVGGRAVACAGIIALGEGRGEAWALLGGDVAPAMPAIVRALRRGLAAAGLRRIQMVSACDFPPAGRLARLLGFKLEGRMTAYMADGSDADLWARI